MTFEYEGIFLICWILRIFILMYITKKKSNLYFLVLPVIFLLIYIINYDIVFWGEIIFLPVMLFFVKTKYIWNCTQYIFYSLFPFVIFDIFSNFANLYDLFLFKVSAEFWYELSWSELVDSSVGFLLCIGFFKLLRVDFKEISEQLIKRSYFNRVFHIFTYSLILYIFTVYLINNFIFLQDVEQF